MTLGPNSFSNLDVMPNCLKFIWLHKFKTFLFYFFRKKNYHSNHVRLTFIWHDASAIFFHIFVTPTTDLLAEDPVWLHWYIYVYLSIYLYMMMNREATQPQRLCQLRKVRDADASQNLQKMVCRPRSTDLLLYVVLI